MLTTPKLSKFIALSVVFLGVVSLSACSKAANNEVGIDPSPQTTAGTAVTSDYATTPATVEQGAPNSQVDPYTGSSVKENYAGEHALAPEQTAGERLDMAKQNMKEAAHEAGTNMKEAGRNVKDASIRIKDKVKDEFDNH
jgi:hypothetical protein